VSALEKAWYKKRIGLHYLLAPLSLLFWCLSSIRALLFCLGLKKQNCFSLPVIVVGNISVGGTGKTPFVIYLVDLLKQQGFKPAIVSRGYGADRAEGSSHAEGSSSSTPFPRLINADSPVNLSGDEPKLLAMRTECPVVIDANRSQAVDYVINNTDCDVVISDDGLQHYAMSRDVEIVLVDQARMFGNGWLLPVGPLRELPSRLKQVDLVLENSGFRSPENEKPDYSLTAQTAINLFDSSINLATKTQVHLISGIGNPERFLQTAHGMGYNISSTTWLPDHHQFTLSDFDKFTQADIILMTEKDAVKCRSLFASSTDSKIQAFKNNTYCLPISAVISAQVEQKLKTLIKNLPAKGN